MDFGSVVKNYTDHLDEASRVYKELVESAFEPTMLGILSNPDINRIIVLGWTPGFNDGEPCEHSTQSYLNYTDREEEDADLNDSEETGGSYGKEFDWKENEELSEVIHRFDSYLAGKYYTNFRLDITAANGQLVVADSEYDCGY